MSAAALNDVAPDKKPTGMVNQPVLFVTFPVMVNIEYVLLSSFNETFKCPLMELVLSSMVNKNAVSNLAASSVLLM